MKKMSLGTPCVGVCSTVYGDDICRGCKRQASEVIDWNRYEESQRQEIFDRLNQEIAQVMENYIAVFDISQLQQQLDLLNIRYRLEQSPYTWAYYLLRAGANKIQDLSKYGLVILGDHHKKNLAKLFDEIDEAIYFIACKNTISSC